MELDNIKLQTTWNDAANSINTNFAKVKQALANGGGGGGGGITTETDPVFSASPAASITETKKLEWDAKQGKLVSGRNIKTINGRSILGGGDITISDIYITDFTVNDIGALVGGYYDGPYIASQIQGLYSALEDHKLILVPFDFDEGYYGYCVAYGYLEDLLYLTINIPHGAWFDLELNHDINEIRGDQITVRQWGDKQNKLISGTNIKTFNGASILGSGNVTIPTKTSQLENNSNFIDKQSADESYISKDIYGELVTANVQGLYGGDLVYALPDQSNGDEDDVLLSQGTVKTINGQNIFGEGNVEISVGISQETDPVFSASPAASITETKKLEWDAKQGKLVSGRNIKTINGQPILGAGNLEIGGSYDDADIDLLVTEVESLGVAVEDLQDSKADVAGYYPEMSVGDLGETEFQNNGSFAFRPTANGVAVKEELARIEAIKGNSVVWNQICRPFSDAVKKPSVAIVNEDGVTIEAWSDYDPFIFPSNLLSRKGHKCILAFSYSNTTPTPTLSVEIADTTRYYFTKDKENIALFLEIAQNSSKDHIEIFPIAPQTGVVTLSNLHIYDLTQMFGAGNEPTTIDEFYKRKPMVADESAYNEGEVIHMDAQSIESVGFNQWDEVLELGTYSNTTGQPTAATTTVRNAHLFPCKGGAKYYWGAPKNAAFYSYDEKGSFLGVMAITSRAEFITPPQTAYAGFRLLVSDYGTTYNHDICINLSNSQKNGTYEPYKRNEQSLDIIRKYFPNGMRSAGTAHDEIRYNKASGKWEAVQNIGSVDIGTLGWFIETSYTNVSYGAVAKDLGATPASTWVSKPNILCSKYIAATPNEAAGKSTIVDVVSITPTSGVYVCPSATYTNAAAFKTAMSGVILYYELAEPIVTEITEDPTLAYEAWSGGTEKVIPNIPSSPINATIAYNFKANDAIRQNILDIDDIKEVNEKQESKLDMLLAKLERFEPVSLDSLSTGRVFLPHALVSRLKDIRGGYCTRVIIENVVFYVSMATTDTIVLVSGFSTANSYTSYTMKRVTMVETGYWNVTKTEQ